MNLSHKLSKKSWFGSPGSVGILCAAQIASITYVGDGAWGMSLAEVLTCVREEIPVVVVVFNNGQWGAEKPNQIGYFDSRFPGADPHNPNFVEVAQAMGANGITVGAEDRVGDVLRQAIDSHRPTVINLRLTQALGDPFRRDAFKPPRHLLPKYTVHGVSN